MRMDKGATFDGPSIRAPRPIVWLRVARDPDDPAGAIPLARLVATFSHLPELSGTGACIQRIIGGIERLGGAASPGRAVAVVAQALQHLAGEEVGDAVVIEEAGAPVFEVALDFEYGEVALLAGEYAVALVDLSGRPSAAAAVGGLRRRFAQIAAELTANAARAELVRAFVARDIPVRRVHQRMVILGHGRYRRLLDFTTTDRAGMLGTWVANDKLMFNRVFGQIGLPVATQVAVTSRDQAIQAAARLGYPVVLKPRGGSEGRLVFVGLADAAEVAAAHDRIAAAGFKALLERLIPGFDHRLLVVDGEMVAAAKRVPGHVVGDGRRSVEALMEEANRDPRRGLERSTAMTLLAMDEEAERVLRRQGLDRAGIPAAGQVVFLRATANVSQGGVAIDVTDAVHPENRALAIRAAAVCGVDILGIDFITPDLSRSHREVGGAICEINAEPGTRLHTAPAEGRGRDVLGPIVDSLFPRGTPSRVPSVAILGGDAAVALAAGHILKLAGHRVGLCVRGEVFVDGPDRIAADVSPPRAAAMVLGDPLVGAAVMLFAPDALESYGLGFDGATVGAVFGTAAHSRAARIVLDGAREAVVLDDGSEPLAARAGARRLERAAGTAAIDAAAAIARALGLPALQITQGTATLGNAYARRLGTFRVLRPGASPVIVIDRLRGNPAPDAVCRLAAAVGADGCRVAVVDGPGATDRQAAVAMLAAQIPAAFRKVIVAGGHTGTTCDGVVGAVDDRAAIAAAVAEAGAQGVVLVLTDNPERACRYAAYATGGRA